MKSKTGRILMALGLVLILGALGLLTYNKLEEKRAAENAAEMADAVMSQIAENTEPDEPENPLEEPGIKELGTIEVDGRLYVGIISIPALDLTLPVIHEWSYPNLKIAPCLYNIDVEKNSMVLAAHNYASHFGSLNVLTGGEEVIFTDVSGHEYRYEVSVVTITQPTDIEGMLDDSWDLTLFTCTYGGATRVTVRCLMV